ncbi:MAG: hypothetical protein AAFW68_01805 [Pseudomonadota bacterium]
MINNSFFVITAVAAALGQAHLAPVAAQESGNVHENGIGPDPDRDTNPATITGVIARIGNPEIAADDAPYRVITFEAPPGAHNDVIRNAYADEFGVRFGNGVTRQICEGQRRFYYDSMCTYEAAPSGKFAAGYLNYLNAPMRIEFDTPVCIVTMAIYPTGGNEEEPFSVTINAWDEAGVFLPQADAKFEWTKNTVRWRHMVGAYYLGGRAKTITVGMKSGRASQAGDVLRFLIDDLAFVQDGCDEALVDVIQNGEQSGNAAGGS